MVAATRQVWRKNWLLPRAIRIKGGVPDAHFARYIVSIVEILDLSEIERAYAGRGSNAYYPAMLLGLLIYGYATGTFSSRKIERAKHECATECCSSAIRPDWPNEQHAIRHIALL